MKGEDSLNRKVKGFVFVLFFVFFLGELISTKELSAKPSEKVIKELREALNPYFSDIERYYYKDVDIDKLFNEVMEVANDETKPHSALNTFVEKMGDPYAKFFTEEELNSFNTTMQGSFYGIGVSVGKAKSGGLLVKEVFSTGPAKEAGIRKKDIIVKIAGEDVTSMDLSDAINLIKGKRGTKVKIELKRGKKTHVFLVERREVVVPSVRGKFYKNSRIGYIKVTDFYENTDEEFSSKLASLKKRKMKGLIIDLRDNGGGYVDTAHNMLEQILPNGKVVFSFRHKGRVSEVFQTGKNFRKDEVLKLPIVILTNKYSASASEIFAGALNDYKVADIIGEKTFGKGVAQSIFEQHDGALKGALKFTTLSYYLPKGESIHEKGITPMMTVVNRRDKKGRLVDRQFNEAFNHLLKKIKEEE